MSILAESIDFARTKCYNADMKTFIFDLYNTLIDIRTDEHCERAWQPVVQMLKERGTKTDWVKLCAEYDRYWKLFEERAAAERKFLYPECDCVTQFESIARSVGGKLSRAEATEALRRMRKASIVWLRLFDGTLELLDGLHARGAKVYLLSNAQSAFTLGEILEVGLGSKLDGALLSSDCGCRKPDPAFFELLFDEYNLDKADAVMVGDDMTNDVRGAERFGIRAVWANGGAATHASELFGLAEGE